MSSDFEIDGEIEKQVNVIDLLANELIEKILCYNIISYYDLNNISLVSKRLCALINSSNEIWRHKLKYSYKQLYEHYNHCNTLNVKSWKQEFITRYVYGREVRKELSCLTDLYFNDDELSDEAFQPFIDYQSHNSHTNSKLFQINELEMILNDGQTNKSLTTKYYAKKVLRYLRHELLCDQWNQLLSSTDTSNCMSLFDGAFRIAQWFQTDVTLSYSYYRKQIQLMAELTIEEIADKYPNNCILVEYSKHCLTDSEANDLSESKWCSDTCKQLLLCLNQVLYKQLRFDGNNHNYYDTCNSYINEVIDKRLGIPITLSVLYHTIAAKLGVKTYPVNFPSHFLIKWKQYTQGEENDCYTYIDAYENGRFLNSNSDLFFNYYPSDECFATCKPIEVFRRMCRNLVEIGRQELSSKGLLCLRNAFELLVLLSPNDVEPVLLLSRVYLQLNINLKQVNDMLQKIIDSDAASYGVVNILKQSVMSQLSIRKTRNTIHVKTRHLDDTNVKYAVGMIMYHKRYNYICVIYGWDPICAATKDWINQMGVYNLINKDKQPFYNVLVEDGSTRYAAQENLELCKIPKEIIHQEIGKYFKEFAGNHYIANEKKASEYPEDNALQKLLILRNYKK